MRMRKKNYREEILNQDNGVLIKDPYQYLGHWHKLLNCKILHVEIGSGKGSYWRQMQRMYPQDGWIAIERNLDVAAVALKDFKTEKPNNSRYIVGDASEIGMWFASGEIDIIHLNFVDPWPKKAHAKRRLTHQRFLNVYLGLLAENGLVIMKTDNQQLIEFSKEEMMKVGLEVIESCDSFSSKEYKKDAMSEYEEKFSAEGLPIYRYVWQVRK